MCLYLKHLTHQFAQANCNKDILATEPPIPELSPRQAEILASLARGLSNVDIATQLGISLNMVKEHTSSLFAKLGVANRAEAVSLALRKHLVKA